MDVLRYFLAVALTMCLNFTTYNSCGLGSGRKDYIRDLLPNSSFLLLQEHWLFDKQLDKLRADLGKNFLLVGASGMDSNSLLHGRPYGGVAIAWHENFSGVVTPVDFESKRVCGITIKVDGLEDIILVLNIYMPTDGGQQSRQEFQNTLMEASALLHAHVTPNVIIGGDFNTDLGRVQSQHRLALLDFMREENLLFGVHHDVSQVDFTYESKSNGCKSLIDHFLLSENMFNCIDSYEVLHQGHNLSDHSSLHLGLNILCRSRDDHRTVNCGDEPNWEIAQAGDVESYSTLLDDFLSDIHIPVDAIYCRNYFCREHLGEIETFHDNIINACLQCARETIPMKMIKEVRGIADWNEEVKVLREKAIVWHTIWVENGRPHNGAVADIRRRTRAAYHYAVRKVKNNKERVAADKLATKMQGKDSREFWKEVSKINKGNSLLPNTMDNVIGSEGICELFAEKFKDVYNSVSYEEEDMEDLLKDISEAVHDKCCKGVCSECHVISFEDVVKGMIKLKRGKSDSIQGIKSDNFIHGGNRLKVMISLLLSSMVNHGCCPSYFSKSTVIPIPKNTRKSMTSSDNYRGITLSSILGKILDYILLHKYSHVFYSSEMQFGFKPGLSTATCSTVVNEIIEYFNNQGTNVYCVMLDASKAFDRVEFIKLFRLLLRKGLCPLVARFLAVLYSNQNIRVRWGDQLSDEFSARNGVKQGGVLSPVLFSIYLDELLFSLANSGEGCYIGMYFAGAFAYADDVVLLAPTVTALRKMLRTASMYSIEFKINFNGSKSRFIIFGESVDMNIEVLFQGVTLRPSSAEIHLGMFFGPSVMQKKIQGMVNDLYKRTNILLSQFRFASLDVKYRLFKSYCMSLYGYQGLDLSSAYIDDIYVAWRRCVRKLLGLPYRTHCALLPLIVRDESIDVQIEQRFVKYLETIFKSCNLYVRLCKDLIVRGSRSPLGKSFNHLFVKCGLDRDKVPSRRWLLRDVVAREVDQEQKRVAEQIRELLDGRDRGMCVLNRGEIDEVLFYLCVG